METEEEVDILMSSDVYSATLSTKSITFSRAQTGWLFREDKTVGVGCCVAVVVIMILLLPPPPQLFPKSAVGHRVSPGCGTPGIFSSSTQTESWEFDQFCGEGRKWKVNTYISEHILQFACNITSVAIYDGKGTQTVDPFTTCLT